MGFFAYRARLFKKTRYRSFFPQPLNISERRVSPSLNSWAIGRGIWEVTRKGGSGTALDLGYRLLNQKGLAPGRNRHGPRLGLSPPLTQHR